MLSQLSYDPIFLLRLFRLLFVVFMTLLGHILTYAPSQTHFDASIKQKILAKNLSWLFRLLFVVFMTLLGHILTYAPSQTHFDASIKQKILAKNLLLIDCFLDLVTRCACDYGL